MISFSALKGSAAGTGKYYAGVGDYYDGGSKEPGQWTGRGAEKLGLKGDVDRKTLVDVLAGKIGEDQETTWDQKTSQYNGKERQMGIDFTFEAPKTVSVMALVGGDQRLIEAHKNAVDKAHGFLEQYAATRVRVEDNKIEHRQTGMLVTSKHFETSSRADDPHMHTHTVNMNMTFDEEKQRWSALEPLHLTRARYASDMVYMQSLAHDVREAGYDITINEETNSFDIVGVPTDVKTFYSKRNEAIKASMAKEGAEGREERFRAHKLTRPEKSKASPAEMLGFQKASLDAAFERGEVSLKAADLVYLAQNTKSTEVKYAKKDLTKAVKYAMERGFFGEAVREEHTLYNYAIQDGMGKFRVEDLKKELSKYTARDDIIHGKENTNDQPLLKPITTRAQLKMEQAFRDELQRGIAAVKPIMKREPAKKHLKEYKIETPSGNFDLSVEQRRAGELVLTTDNRFTVIQGVAGGGKSELVAGVAKAVKAVSRRAVIGTAPTGKAVKELEEKTGIPVMTTQRLIITKGREVPIRAIVFADEASMNDNKMGSELAAIARKGKFRLVTIGDRGQLPAIDAGRPHENSLQQAQGIAAINKSMRQIKGSQAETVASVVRLAQNVQQDRAPGSIPTYESTKASGWTALKGALGSGLVELKAETADKSKLEIAETLAGNAAKDWLADSDKNKGPVLVVDNLTRRILNERVRDGLIQKGEVARDGGTFDMFIPMNVPHAEMTRVRGFAGAEVIVAQTKNRQIHSEKGEIFDIAARRADSLLLVSRGMTVTGEKTKKGRKVELRPHKTDALTGLSLYKEDKREMATGDRIIFTQKSGEIANGTEGKIIGLEGSKATIKVTHGKGKRVPLAVDLEKAKFWDQGYGVTVMKAQGATMDVTRAIFSSKDPVNAKTLYTAVTRAKSEVKLFTNNFGSIIQKVAKNSGQKTSALYAIKDKDMLKERHRIELMLKQKMMEVFPQFAENIAKITTTAEKAKETEEKRLEKAGLGGKELNTAEKAKAAGQGKVLEPTGKAAGDKAGPEKSPKSKGFER